MSVPIPPPKRPELVANIVLKGPPMMVVTAPVTRPPNPGEDTEDWLLTEAEASKRADSPGGLVYLPDFTEVQAVTFQRLPPPPGPVELAQAEPEDETPTSLTVEAVRMGPGGPHRKKGTFAIPPGLQELVEQMAQSLFADEDQPPQQHLRRVPDQPEPPRMKPFNPFRTHDPHDEESDPRD